MAGDGVANTRIATTLGIGRPTVLNWRGRFLIDGLDSVGEVRPGRGRKPEITAHQVQEIVHATLHETPPGATHWSCRSMAKAAGVSRSTVQRIWDAHGLQPPHRITTFKLSKDPAFVEKLTDVVGLYLNPPDKAVVLCVDEKSQIQALDRTQPGPADEAGPARHHDPRLQAAWHDDVVRRVERADRRGHRPMPRPSSAPGILEVPAAPRPGVPGPTSRCTSSWTTTRPTSTRRFASGWPPARASNYTSRPPAPRGSTSSRAGFSKLTEQRLRRGVFCSVQELVAAIKDYLTHHNAEPKPFVWSTTVDAIIEKVSKCKVILGTHH